MGAIREVLEECLEAWANMLRKKKGECLNSNEPDCKCTVCKINRILGEEEIGLVPEFVQPTPVPFQYTDKPQDYPETYEDVDLSKVYKLYPKIICVEQRNKLGGGWTNTFDIDGVETPISMSTLYYEYGMRWVIARCKLLGSTMVQLRCRDEKGELAYPDYHIHELLK